LPLPVSGFDQTTKAGYLSLPTSGNRLESDGAITRTVVGCFATKETLASVSGAVAGDYVTLQDTVNIVPEPRLGPLETPTSLRAVTGSSPSFRIHNFYTGDAFFFASDCSSGVPQPSESSTGILAATYDSSTGSGGFSLPSQPPSHRLTDLEGSTRTLKCCFASARLDHVNPLNWFEVVDTLNLIPDPTSALITTWKQRSVDVLDFSRPAGHAAQVGDLIVLQRENCENADQLSATGPGIGVNHSAPMFLEEGGIASTFAIAQSKINELTVGTYKICMATKSSEFDTDTDFKELAKEITLTETAVSTPHLVVPDSLHLGVDIVVVWNATDGQYMGVSLEGSWLGLYKKGDCAVDSEWQHKCYLVAHELPVGESGGVVRFSQRDYKTAGEYEIRYFRGDTRSGQGQVCSGLRDTGSGTYIHCTLQAAATSSAIHVYGNIETQDDLASVPGLEHVVLV